MQGMRPPATFRPPTYPHCVAIDDLESEEDR